VADLIRVMCSWRRSKPAFCLQRAIACISHVPPSRKRLRYRGEAFDVRLFPRHSRTLGLTEDGPTYYERCRSCAGGNALGQKPHLIGAAEQRGICA